MAARNAHLWHANQLRGLSPSDSHRDDGSCFGSNDRKAALREAEGAKSSGALAASAPLPHHHSDQRQKQHRPHQPADDDSRLE
eukprot:2008000-Rhodomonas_salina.1